MEEKEKFQVFTLKINEEDVGAIISMLMKCMAGDVYHLLKNMESQTKTQRDLPEDQKEFEPNKGFIFKDKKKES